MTYPIELACELPPRHPAEDAAAAVAAQLQQEGFLAYLVGGAVRDRLLERTPTEADVTTDARPEQVQALFGHTVAVGARFGVVVVVHQGVNVEVATFRTDGGYQDGRHPDSVAFADAAHDAARRDFTVNALFYDCRRQVVLDFVGGLEDLRQGVLRAIGDAERRFAEDYLRLLRAVRFTARFGFVLAPETRAALEGAAPQIRHISAERICAELTRMLTGPHPDHAFRLLEETGLLAAVLPEVDAMRKVAQPAVYHPEGDVWQHTLLMLRLVVNPSPRLAWAALLHDVGKPPTFACTAGGRETFPKHAPTGARMAGAILQRLRCSRRLIEDVTEMVRAHMSFGDVLHMRQSTLRRLLGKPTFADELELHRLDCAASHGRHANYAFLLDRLAEYRDREPLPPPLVNGHDVLSLGIAPGPQVGLVLTEARERQLNGELSDRPAALTWLRQRLTDSNTQSQG